MLGEVDMQTPRADFSDRTGNYEPIHPLLHEYFERQVPLRADHPAVWFGDESLTYAELDRYANQIARTLKKRGVTSGDLVALYLKKSQRLFAAMLGILKAGAGYIPIDPRFPLERIRDILSDSGARAFVSEGALADDIEGQIETTMLRLDRDAQGIAGVSTDRLPKHTDLTPSNLCYVIYTSGSTGRPKGVMLEHRNAAAFLETLAPVYQVTPEDRIYQGFSTSFDASVEEVWAAFAIGGTLVVPTEEVTRSPADVVEFIARNNITYFSTVPTFLSMIDSELASVRTLVLGGEACPPDLVTRWATPGRRMLNTYGPTEATVVATYSECRPGAVVTIGGPMPGYATYVLDEERREVGQGETGQLFIGGPAVARGYMNLPDLTNECFIEYRPEGSDRTERLYGTRDLVRIHDNGEYLFLGRMDGQIKIRGFRVELSEIEAVLVEHSDIKAAAVTVFEDEGLKELAGYVVLEARKTDLDRQSVADLLRSRVPEYMVPMYLDIVDDLPVMTSGKVDRRSLPAPTSLLMESNRSIVSPQNELEQQIVQVWQECFRVSAISIEDDFFADLQGHSLMAAKVARAMRDKIGLSHFSVRDIYRHSTVKELARSLEDIVGPGWKLSKGRKEIRGMTAAEEAFNSVPVRQRRTVVMLQAITLFFYYGIAAAPVAYTTILMASVLQGQMEWADAAEQATIVAFLAWPSMLALSIAIKWLVIGRYKPGSYPVWGFYYFRWWMTTRFQPLGWPRMFAGTPLMTLYCRAMGAKVGKGVTIATPICAAFDVISIGDGSSIGAETHMLGYRVEDGMLHIAPVKIGQNCFVGMQCCLGLDTTLQDEARLDDMSLLNDGEVIPAGGGRRGIPAKPAEVAVPRGPERGARRRPILFGLLHLLLIYVMGYFLIATMIPALVLVAGAWVIGGAGLSVVAALLSVPLSLIVFVISVVALKWLLIGRIKPGTYPLASVHYLRHWFLGFLLENMRDILEPVYATVYLPPLFRMLGAKIGKGSEISTALQVNPDLLEVGSGSFLADACLVGGQRIHGGVIEVLPVYIGSRTFVGNSALVPGGTVIGNDALIGVGSTPPVGEWMVPHGSRWLGAPGFALPRTQRDNCFAQAETFEPSAAVKRARARVDALRILIPGLVLMAHLVALVTIVTLAHSVLPLWAVVLVVPFAMVALVTTMVTSAALIKRIALGKIDPIVKPLWSRFVWFNELVNGSYEAIAGPVMEPMLGTPFVSSCLRAMGCRIGKWCFLETTLFSEFDLVWIGDFASLNLGATIQTHLFEDRVFKADYLRIGTGCSVANMAVVLYDTRMQRGASLAPMSVLMKGDLLPESMRWQGVPCEPMSDPQALSATQIDGKRVARLMPATLEAVEAALANSIGPLAEVIVRKISEKTTNPDQLLAALSEQILSESEARRFRQEAEIVLRGDKAVAAVQLDATLSGTDVQVAGDALVQFVGPFANVLARKLAEDASGRGDYYQQLAEAIPDEDQRAHFLAKMKKHSLFVASLACMDGAS
jgi:non-ribosomal peptide synthetase-like protein